jgi:DNA replication and repair protein RecF
VHLSSIEISSLRNISSIHSPLPRGIVFIHGKNGQGKTSILEAIFLLSHARSFRTSSIKDLITPSISGKNIGETSSISAIVESSLGNFELRISIHQGKRDLFVNDKKVTSTSEFCGRLKTVLFTPEDLELVKGGPVMRRQFLDRVLVMLEPGLMKDLSEYSKLLKTRNTLLQEGEYKKASIFNEPLITKNHLLATKRKELLDQIKVSAQEFYKKIVTQENEAIQFEYKSSFMKDGEILSIEESRKVFESSIDRDKKHGRTNVGIHKDEVVLSFSSLYGKGLSKVISSQGQIRCFSLCSKLASAEYISEKTLERPILLLDDVDSELDDERRESLYELIDNYKGQIFLTGTRLPEPSVYPLQDKINTQIFHVSGGALKSV